MASVSAWEGIFMLVVLKIPMIYLAAVVFWAVRAEPAPDDGFEPSRALVPLTPCGWDERRRHRARRLPVRRPIRPAGGARRRSYPRVTV